MSDPWAIAIVATLAGLGIAAILWNLIVDIVGGETMQNFARRVTSREFLAFGFVAVYAILITVGGYDVPKYVSEVIVPAVLLFGGFMAVTGRTNG